MDSNSTTSAPGSKQNTSRTNKVIAIVVVIAVATAGLTLLVTRALGPFASLELESSTPTAKATVGTDTNASGGKYLQFGSGATSGGGGGDTTPPPAAGSYWTDYYKTWSNGPDPTGDPKYFPIGVWMQDPSRIFNGKPNGTNYQNIGINLDVGIWEDDFSNLRYDGLTQTGWKGIIPGERAGTSYGKNAASWWIEDEADMNMWNDPAKFNTQVIKKSADAAKAKDPTRPTYANYGKTMAPGGCIAYYNQSKCDVDLPAYCDAVDLVSVDFYGYTDPWIENSKAGAWWYGAVLDSLRERCNHNPKKPVWGFVEAMSPDYHSTRAITPDEMEAAIWNMVVHGANGLIYFAHDFGGTGAEDGMLHDAAISARAAKVNAQIKSLAPILNSYSQSGVSATGTNGIPVSTMYKVYNGSKYVFAAADGNDSHTNSGTTTGTITVPVSSGTATVVNENRTVTISGGKIVDTFKPYQMHVYQF
ncbi:MAG TPA: hypothetical protein VMY99_01990 [Nevskiaceae bacterium]|nr:hypothetical protein [Nevskiaceae bacterium]